MILKNHTWWPSSDPFNSHAMCSGWVEGPSIPEESIVMLCEGIFDVVLAEDDGGELKGGVPGSHEGHTSHVGDILNSVPKGVVICGLSDVVKVVS